MDREYRQTDIKSSGLPIWENPTLSVMRSDYGKRLFEARFFARLTQNQLAKRVGITQSTLSQLESTGSGSIYTTDLARELGVRPEWLANGELPMCNTNVEPGPDIRGLVPLISWVQAGQWSGAMDTMQPGEGEQWLACPRSHSQGTYALRVRGDSMTAPHGNSRTYPEGSIIFVDPDKKMPSNGDRIIAKLDGSDEVTFKIYKNEDGRQWLQPLNPAHEPIRDSFRVLGTIIGKWEEE